MNANVKRSETMTMNEMTVAEIQNRVTGLRRIAKAEMGWNAARFNGDCEPAARYYREVVGENEHVAFLLAARERIASMFELQKRDREYLAAR
jgi:hypothetical protein